MKTRREFIRNLSLGFGVLSLRSLLDPLSIELDTTVDLQSQAIFKFIFSSNTEYTSETPSLDGYTITKKTIEAGTISDITDTASTQSIPLTLYGQVKEYYGVYQNRSLISHFDVIIPVKQRVSLTIISHLLIKDNIDASQKPIIEKAFSDYNASSGISPMEYALKIISELKLPSDSFATKNSFKLTKIGRIEEDRSQIDRIKALYNGKDTDSSMTVLNKDYKVGKYFTDKKITIALIKREELLKIEPIVKDIHQMEESDVSKMDDIMKQEVSKAATDCEPTRIKRQDIEICQVGAYPEAKTDWEWTMVKIGCIKTKIYYPVVFKRITKIKLFAYVGTLDNITQIVLSQVMSCARKAAIASAVISVVLLNLAEGIVAFQALFIDCVEYNLKNDFGCLFPGLFLLEEKTQWSRL